MNFMATSVLERLIGSASTRTRLGSLLVRNLVARMLLAAMSSGDKLLLRNLLLGGLLMGWDASLSLAAQQGQDQGSLAASYSSGDLPVPNPSQSSLAAPVSVADITLLPGKTVVLPAAGVKRVAVGNGQIIEAVVVEASEVLVFGRAAGESSLHVWLPSGKRQDFRVRVESPGAQEMHEELNRLLQAIPAARTRRVGEKVVIEGERLSNAERARIATLVERYPGVVDFTSAVGWEPMIMFDVQVVEIPRQALKEWGVRWNGASQGGIHAGLGWDAAGSRRPSENGVDSPLSPANRMSSFSGYLGANMLFSSRLHALVESGDAVVLAQPQLVARNGSTAEFLAGGEVPYTTVDHNGKSDTQFKPYGVSLQMTPYLDPGGIIRAQLVVEASAVDGTVSGSAGPALKTRRASTEFNVRSGHTLVLAGFLSHERTTRRDGLPGLSRLPVVGALFGARRESRQDIELVIFVTPSVVQDDDPIMVDAVSRARTQVMTSRQLEPGIAPISPHAAPSHGRGAPSASGWDRNPFYGAGSQWDSASIPGPRDGDGT